MMTLMLRKDPYWSRCFWWSSIDMTFWSNLTSSFLAHLHSIEHSKVDCFINRKWRINCWCVSAFSKGRLHIVSSLPFWCCTSDLLMDNFNFQHGCIWKFFNINLLMSPQYVWLHIEDMMSSTSIFWRVSFHQWLHIEDKMMSFRCRLEPFWTLFWSSILRVKIFIILI